MTIKDMHYDFKKKLNKLDSQKNRNLLIPEIDWTLNEAQELFVKMVAKPRQKTNSGFEESQRSIDDIKTLVKTNQSLSISENVAELPQDYWYFIKGKANMSKGVCTNVKGTLKIVQQDDSFETSPFDKSSFEWRIVNAIFTENGIKVFTDNTFEVNSILLSYIKKLDYIHNAEDFRNGSYNLPSGVQLTGSVNSILPEHTHREIVDIAVLIAAEEIQSSNYVSKIQKLSLNNLTSYGNN